MKKRIYLITDDKLPFEELLFKTEVALSCGVSLLQYRAKNKAYRIMLEEALSLKKLCLQYEVPLIINDSIQLAKEIDADGVHLGQNDESIEAARNILEYKGLHTAVNAHNLNYKILEGIKIGNKMIGATAKTLAQARDAEKRGATYLGVGALFSSPTKPTAISMDFNTLKDIRDNTKLSLFGIGGITEKNLTSEIVQLLDGVALISTIYNADNIKQIIKLINKKLGE